MLVLIYSLTDRLKEDGSMAGDWSKTGENLFGNFRLNYSFCGDHLFDFFLLSTDLNKILQSCTRINFQDF